ncbi:MAG: nickel pincer cofactor biosynthesis protein LarC [Planctomycetales bacterium]|nr:nickel pincer cofactor biosynthesis protein LarC [Planctomycetales bacterium]
MRALYLDCPSGISGDMVLGAMVDAGVDLTALQAGIDSLGLPSCRLEAEEVKRCGFRATKVHVRHEPEHAHRHLHHITDMIDGSNLSDSQKSLAKRIFTRLGEAEAQVHGTTIRKVHFHEVGAVDSIADIVGAAIAFDVIGVEKVFCSHVPTGSGYVTIAHGRCSVPAPATAELLKGIPIADSIVAAELTTPTGAAIVASIVDQFRHVPPMTIETIGYGAGDKDFTEQGNVLRLFVGDLTNESEHDRIVTIETNLDDVTAETIGHCFDLLFAAGALDVYATSIQMKKNRPGTKITVLSPAANVADIEDILFRETSTLGVRKWESDRRILRRKNAKVETDWGTVRGKLIFLPDAETRFSPEYDDCAKLSKEAGVPLRKVMEAATRAAQDLAK